MLWGGFVCFFLCCVVCCFADQCCWCGKRYFEGGKASFPPSVYVDAPAVVGSVLPSKSFFVVGVDFDPKVVVFVSQVLGAAKLAIPSLAIEAQLQNPVARHTGVEVFEVALPIQILHTNHTALTWTIESEHHQPITGEAHIYTTISLVHMQQIGASRVVYTAGSSSIERFSTVSEKPQPFFPFGFFLSWPLLKENITAQTRRTIGSILHPVSPFDEGLVEGALDAAALQNVQWMFDMRHITTNLTAVSAIVQRYREHPGIFSWYISDEPDGAGDTEGLPTGRISPSQLKLTYKLVRSIDPYHVVSASLNCQFSAGMYVEGTDVLMPDVYPVGINVEKCSESYGCCGCDGCVGGVGDVTLRLQTVNKLIAFSKPVHFVGQAFGGTGEHWSRAPTPDELRVMTYLGFMNGGANGGISYWLQSNNTSPLLAESRELYSELSQLHNTQRGNPIVQTVLPSELEMHVHGWCTPQNHDSSPNHVLILVNPSPQSKMVVDLHLPALTSVNSTVNVIVGGDGKMDLVAGQVVSDSPLRPMSVVVVEFDAPCADEKIQLGSK